MDRSGRPAPPVARETPSPTPNDDRTPEEDWRAHREIPRELSVSVCGIRIRYVDVDDHNEGVPVLLLHGIGASYRSWLTTIPALASRRRVIALDLPGFGMSERIRGIPNARDVADFVDAFCHRLGLGSVHVVGHSMGGLVAMQLTSAHPGRVESVALVASSLQTVLSLFRHPVRALRRAPRVCLSFAYQMTSATLSVPEPLLRFMLANPLLRGAAFSSFVHRPKMVDTQAMFEAFSCTGRLGSLLALSSAGRFAFEETLGAIDAAGKDVLVIVGTEDRLALAEDSAYICERVRGVRLIRLPATGHWPMLECPGELNSLLRLWFTSALAS